MKAKSGKVKSILVGLIATAFGAVLFIGCAPTFIVLSEGEDDGAVEQVSFTWSAESDCGMCHEDEVTSFTKKTCLAYNHTDALCTDCHADTAALETVHANMMTASAPTKLQTTRVADESCLVCHTREEIQAAGVDKLQDAEGTLFNPHLLTSSESHDAIECTDCHNVHGRNKISQTAVDVCTDCHHKGIFRDCGQCHQ